jgi:hypothetical protein
MAKCRRVKCPLQPVVVAAPTAGEWQDAVTDVIGQVAILGNTRGDRAVLVITARMAAWLVAGTRSFHPLGATATAIACRGIAMSGRLEMMDGNIVTQIIVARIVIAE